jgi:fatty acid desaturase
VAGVAAPVERAWRERIEGVITPDEIRALSDRSLRDSVTLLALLWVEIAVLLTAANLLPQLPIGWAVFVGVVLVVLIATRINALNVVIHEGSHVFLAPSRRLNDRLCNIGAAWWTLNSVEEYRPTHRLHHRYLGEERDPDRPSYLLPAGRPALLRLLASDLLGITAVKRGLVLLRGGSTEEGAGSAGSPLLFAGKAVTQLVLLGQFVLFQGLLRGIVFYVVFWLVPLLSLFPIILRLKTITEHFDPRLRDPDQHLWIARTSAAGWLQDRLIGARMEYHFEHHVLPSIPFGGLRRLHRKLATAGMFERSDELLSHGYVRFVSRLLAQG